MVKTRSLEMDSIVCGEDEDLAGLALEAPALRGIVRPLGTEGAV